MGGHYVGDPGKEIMVGAMYVEVMDTEKYPASLSQSFSYVEERYKPPYRVLQTPDGRPGWAYHFLNEG